MLSIIGCWLTGHQYVPNLRNSVQSCTRCGKSKKIPCKHRWENIEKCDIVATGRGGVKYNTGVSYIQQCTECGELQRKKYDFV